MLLPPPPLLRGFSTGFNWRSPDVSLLRLLELRLPESSLLRVARCGGDVLRLLGCNWRSPAALLALSLRGVRLLVGSSVRSPVFLLVGVKVRSLELRSLVFAASSLLVCAGLGFCTGLGLFTALGLVSPVGAVATSRAFMVAVPVSNSLATLSAAFCCAVSLLLVSAGFAPLLKACERGTDGKVRPSGDKRSMVCAGGLSGCGVKPLLLLGLVKAKYTNTIKPITTTTPNNSRPSRILPKVNFDSDSYDIICVSFRQPALRWR